MFNFKKKKDVDYINEFINDGMKIGNINKVLRMNHVSDYKLKTSNMILASDDDKKNVHESLVKNLRIFSFYTQKIVGSVDDVQIKMFLIYSSNTGKGKTANVKNSAIELCQEKIKKETGCDYGMVLIDQSFTLIKKIKFNQVTTFLDSTSRKKNKNK